VEGERAAKILKEAIGERLPGKVHIIKQRRHVPDTPRKNRGAGSTAAGALRDVTCVFGPEKLKETYKLHDRDLRGQKN